MVLGAGRWCSFFLFVFHEFIFCPSPCFLFSPKLPNQSLPRLEGAGADHQPGGLYAISIDEEEKATSCESRACFAFGPSARPMSFLTPFRPFHTVSLPCSMILACDSFGHCSKRWPQRRDSAMRCVCATLNVFGLSRRFQRQKHRFRR